MEKLRIRLLQGTYAVCQIKDTENILNCLMPKKFLDLTPHLNLETHLLLSHPKKNHKILITNQQSA